MHVVKGQAACPCPTWPSSDLCTVQAAPTLHMTHLATIARVHCPGRPHPALLRLLLPPLSLLLHLLLSPLPLRLRLLRPFLLLLTAPRLPLSALLSLLLLRGRRAPWVLLLLRGRRWLLLPGWRRGWSTATSRLLPRRRWWRKMWRGEEAGAHAGREPAVGRVRSRRVACWLVALR